MPSVGLQGLILRIVHKVHGELGRAKASQRPELVDVVLHRARNAEAINDLVNPRGEIIAQAAESRDELLVAELDLDLIDEVRSTWQFYRDRRPDSYESLVAP